MENKDEILKKINSNDTDLIREAIQEIKTEGDLSIVPPLMQRLSTETGHNTTEIINLLADIKDNAFKELLIHEIQKTTHQTFKTLLLRICWESSLDYAAYLNLFLEIMQKDEFTTALEASTVIENMLHNISPEQCESLSLTLKSNIYSEDKRFLADNLLTAIQETDE